MEIFKYKYHKPMNKKVLFWMILIVGLIPTIYGMISATVFGTWSEYKMYCIPSSVFSLLVTATLFIVNIAIFSYFHTIFPKHDQAVKRVLIALLLAQILSNFIIYVYWELYNSFYAHVADDKGIKFSNHVITIVLVTIVDLVFEARYYLIRWHDADVEKEQLQKANSISQLETLRTQLSPHFLFNSFNALQSLIDMDTERAKDFVQELAKVYRYSLENKDDLVVELKDELNFINSYIYLNKIRFGENLQYHCNVNAESLKKFVPPLTLQLLVENAIKHNIISAEKPLQISIYTVDNILTVENNLQLRTEKLISTGIGLENLKNRYALIYHQLPEFISSKEKYIARIPLIDKENVQ